MYMSMYIHIHGNPAHFRDIAGLRPLLHTHPSLLNLISRNAILDYNADVGASKNECSRLTMHVITMYSRSNPTLYGHKSSASCTDGRTTNGGISSMRTCRICVSCDSKLAEYCCAAVLIDHDMGLCPCVCPSVCLSVCLSFVKYGFLTRQEPSCRLG